MKNFDYFMKMISKSSDRDPWVKNKKVEGYCEEILNEAKEVIKAVLNKDNNNLKEELGDVLYDWAHACKLAEEQGIFTVKDVIHSATEKLLRRKPYLLEKDNRNLTSEETVRIWMKAKEKERKLKKPRQEEFVYHVDNKGKNP